MIYLARIIIIAMFNLILSLIIAPPDDKNNPIANLKRIWVSRYTIVSYRVLVLAIILYFILSSKGWK